jgi:hypothetical protein
MLADSELARARGAAARARAELVFSYDHLAADLADALEGMQVRST